MKVIEKSKPRTTSLNEPLCRAVIDYLNLKAEKNFRNATASSKLITARYNEGYKLEDFMRVIDTKSSQWLNTDFDKFLRPSTLFNATKFQEYLAEKPSLDKSVVNKNIKNSQIGFYDV